MRILHTGMGWFSEDAGGLSRYMSQALVAQTGAGHVARGLVTGTGNTEHVSGGLARPFAARTDRIDRRLRGLRREFSHARTDFRPDLATFHFALYARPLMGLLDGLPWVMHFHGPWALEGRAEGARPAISWIRQHLVEKPVYRKASRVVTLSRCFASILQESYGVDPDRIRVVPGGFDPTPFHDASDRMAARVRHGLALDAPVLVCVRRLASRMGLENLVDAAGILKAKYPNLVVAIAGKGPIAKALKERIDGSGLQANVRLLGFVPDDDLPSLYAAADLSVVPTVALEGFGLIVAESLASGTPVVASRVGALPELLGGFTDDLLAPPDAHGLAATIDRAISNRGSLPDRTACRLHAQRWAWENVTPRLLEVYAEARDANSSKSGSPENRIARG